MPLWSSSNVSVEQEPKWVANSATPYNLDPFKRYDAVYADKRGWQLVHPSNGGATELIVAIRGLSDKLGAPLINYAHFSKAATANGYPANGISGLSNTTVTLDGNTAFSLNVVYNQQVQVIGGPPNVNITQTGAISSNIKATYATGNGTNILTFNFTTPTDFQGNTNANTVLTITGQPLVVPGSMNGVANVSMSANIWIPTAANTNWPFQNRTPTLLIQHPITQIANVNFQSATVARNTASNVFVNFSAPVNVLTTALPNVKIQVAAGNTTNATYASGNGTSNLRFSFTAPQFVANVMTISAGQLIFSGSINDTMNAAVNTFVTAANATFTGNSTPT